MPIDYRKYPPDWKTQIRPDILRRANNRCEMCGAENGKLRYGKETVKWEKGDDWMGCRVRTKIIRVVLTIAHLDHDITNNDYSNLMALCQRCHLALDKEQHQVNSAKTRTIKKKDKEQQNGQRFLDLE